MFLDSSMQVVDVFSSADNATPSTAPVMTGHETNDTSAAAAATAAAAVANTGLDALLTLDGMMRDGLSQSGLNAPQSAVPGEVGAPVVLLYQSGGSVVSLGTCFGAEQTAFGVSPWPLGQSSASAGPSSSAANGHVEALAGPQAHSGLQQASQPAPKLPLPPLSADRGAQPGHKMPEDSTTRIPAHVPGGGVVAQLTRHSPQLMARTSRLSHQSGVQHTGDASASAARESPVLSSSCHGVDGRGRQSMAHHTSPSGATDSKAAQRRSSEAAAVVKPRASGTDSSMRSMSEHSSRVREGGSGGRHSATAMRTARTHSASNRHSSGSRSSAPPSPREGVSGFSGYSSVSSGRSSTPIVVGGEDDSGDGSAAQPAGPPSSLFAIGNIASQPAAAW